MNNTIKILDPLFSEKGYKFIKTKKTWVKQNEKIIVICQYQKSRFSNNFFLNLGIYFKYGNNLKKKSVLLDHCFLTARYDQVFQDFSALDIEDNCFEDLDVLEKKLSITKNKIRNELLPLLDEMLDIKYFRNNLDSYPNEHWWLRNITRDEFNSILKE